jgi:hypothetical protein
MRLRRMLCLGLLAAVLTVAGCGSTATPEPTPVPTADTTAPTHVPATDAPAPTATTKVSIPAPIEGEIPTGFTEEGWPYRGHPDAPVTLVEYSDFQ